jgi:hypothetical protein
MGVPIQQTLKAGLLYSAFQGFPEIMPCFIDMGLVDDGPECRAMDFYAEEVHISACFLTFNSYY